MSDRERIVSDRERIGKWADLVYLRYGRVVHVLPFDQAQGFRLSCGPALCGRRPDLRWLGRGSYSEMERAHALRICLTCSHLAERRRA